MKPNLFAIRPLLLACSFSMLAFVTGISSQAQFQRDAGNPFAAPKATVHAARERTYHVRHMQLNFDVDATNHGAKGVVTHYLTPLKEGLSEIAMDAGQNLKIEKCSLSGQEAKFKHEGGKLIVMPNSPLSVNEVALEIKYELPSSKGGAGLMGAGGLVWIDPRPNDPNRRPAFYTQGETETNHFWVPCYDFPNDKVTSETITTVPENWTVIGNGYEGKVTNDAAKKTKTFRWKMTQPHSTYLLSLVAGEMDVVRAKWGRMPLIYASPKGTGELLHSTFDHTPDMLSFFSKTFGVKYAWPKYAQTCVPDFGGGMENVSATTLGVFLSDSRSTKNSSSSLTSHELGHQWFGDLVTCNDWGDTWLNEGFATFAETIYIEHQSGKDAYEQERVGNLRGYLNEARRYKRPESTQLYANGDVMFDAHTYNRGSLVLHMLRRELGDKTFFAGIKNYLNKHAYQNVVTADFSEAMSKTSGRDLGAWFKQWVFSPGHPVLDYSWSYDDNTKNVVLKVKQTQDVKSGTPIYNLPIKVALLSAGDVKLCRTVSVVSDRAEQEFQIPVTIKPDSLVLDPEHDLLAELKAPKWAATELPALLKFAPSYQERSRAARQLLAGENGKDESMLKLVAEAVVKETSDPAATGMLEELSGAKQEFLRSVFRKEAQSKQEGRRAVALTALGTLPATEQDTALLRKIAMDDKEPYSAVGGAMKGLARVDLVGNLDILKHQVEMKSSRDQLAFAAVGALAEAKLEAGVPILVAAAKPGHGGFLRYTAINGIGTLAPGDKSVLETLLAIVKDEESPFLLNAAISALKTRKEKSAVNALRVLAKNTKNTEVRDSAKEAADELMK